MGERLERALLRAFRAPSFELRVVGTEQLAPRLLKLDVDCPDFIEAAEIRPGLWLRLWIPGPQGKFQRAYTVIGADREAGTFSLEFYLHGGGGVAAAWARAARPGMRIEAALYEGKSVFDPGEAAEVLLVGDLTSLPAINEICASTELPKTVILEATAPGDESFPTEVDRPLWLEQRVDSANTLAALPKRDLSGCACFIAGETSMVRSVRKELLARGAQKRLLKSQGYWIRGRSMGTAVK